MAGSIQISEEVGVRQLHFGSRWIQGAMRIARPFALELEYTRDMMLPLLLRAQPRWPRHVLLIGLGAASLVKFLHRHRPQATLTVVEIAPEVVTAAWQFFKLPDDARRLAIEIGDGADYVMTSDRQFDLILVDGYDAKGRTGMLDTLPFYCNARARLSDTGVLATNLLSRSRGVAPSLARAREAFDGRARAFPPCASGNTIVLAATGEPIDVAPDEFGVLARRLKVETALNLLPALARWREAGGGRFEL
ncbi:MAG: spermidine synthase [Betaproteobacteria bacterium]